MPLISSSSSHSLLPRKSGKTSVNSEAGRGRGDWVGRRVSMQQLLLGSRVSCPGSARGTPCAQPVPPQRLTPSQPIKWPHKQRRQPETAPRPHHFSATHIHAAHERPSFGRRNGWQVPLRSIGEVRIIRLHRRLRQAAPRPPARRL